MAPSPTTNAPQKLDGTAKKRADRPGRPPKLTRELIEKIAAVVRNGCYLDTAARYCGVSKASFHDWMKRGHEQKGRGIYRQFLDALEEAQAAADVKDHLRLTKAGDKDWRAIAEHLRLRNPDRYSRRTEVSGPGGKPVAVQTSVEASLMDMFTKLAGEPDGSGEG